MNANTLSAIEAVNPFRSTDAGRMWLHRAAILSDKVFATDGHRAAIVHMDTGVPENATKWGASCVPEFTQYEGITAPSIDAVMALNPIAKAKVVAIIENTHTFLAECARLKKVFNKNAILTLEVANEVASIRVAYGLTDKEKKAGKLRPISFTLPANQYLVASGESPQGLGVTSVGRIGVNLDYLIDALEFVGAFGEVSLLAQDDSSPVYITHQNRTALVMPVKF